MPGGTPPGKTLDFDGRWGFGINVIIAPIVVGQHVVVATPSTLFVLNVGDGGVVSKDELPNVLGPDEQNVSSPLAGFAAANGMLFVPAGTSIVAY